MRSWPRYLRHMTHDPARLELTPEEMRALGYSAVDALVDDGFAFVTSTELKGRTCLRFCTINPRITDDDLSDTIERIVRFGDAQKAVE